MFTCSLLILEDKILPVQGGVSCALRGWDRKYIQMLGEAEGREEEKGWQAASKLGLSDTCLTASLAEAGDAFSSIYVTILPKPFQNFRLWRVFFATTSTTCLFPFA